MKSSSYIFIAAALIIVVLTVMNKDNVVLLKPATDTVTVISQGQPSEKNSDICLYSCPSGAPATNKTIQRPIYILSNNGKTKFADWVAYKVTSHTIGHTQKRVWHKDPDLPDDETLSPDDYKGAHEALHIDRGHQAPLASLTGTPYWDMADDLSNITPQSTDLNEGPWEKLEQAERDLVIRKHVEVHTITGPLYKRPMPKLPHSHLEHTIPSDYWKVVALQEGQSLRIAAFIMDQELSRDADYCSQATTISEVEEASKLKLFPQAPQEIRLMAGSEKGSLLSDLGCP